MVSIYPRPNLKLKNKFCPGCASPRKNEGLDVPWLNSASKIRVPKQHFPAGRRRLKEPPDGTPSGGSLCPAPK